MKRFMVALLFLATMNVVQAEQGGANTQRKPSNTTVITNDNRVIYDEKTKQLIGVKKQTVCREVNGKKECHNRAVSTMIDK